MVLLPSMVNDLPPLVKSEIEYRKKLLGETKLEQERLRKKEMIKAEDALDEIGQENEKKGIAATMKAMQKDWDQQFTVKQDRINWLNKKAQHTKDRRLDYYPYVKTLVDYELSWLTLPIGYTVKSEVTNKGIKLVMRDRWGEYHIGGFTPSGLGVYDEQACRTSVNKLDDKITQLENNPPSGVFLP